MSIMAFGRSLLRNRLAGGAAALCGLASLALGESSLVLRVQYSPDRLTLNARVIESLIESDAVAGEVQRRLHKSGLLAQGDEMQLELQPLAEGPLGRPSKSEGSRQSELLASVVARFDSESTEAGNPPAEQEALKIVPQLLRASIDGLAAAERVRLQQQVAQTETQVQGLTQQLTQAQARRAQLMTQAGGVLPQRAEIVAEIRGMEEERDKALGRLASLDLREQAIAQQIKTLTESSQAAADSNALVIDLMKLLQMQEQNAEQARKLAEQGAASNGDVAKALEELVHVRMQLEEQRSKTLAPTESQIAALGQMLRDSALQRAQIEGDRAAADERLKAISDRKLLDLADQYDREFRVQIDALESQLERLRSDLFDLRQDADSFRPPQVQVLGPTAEE